MRARTLLGIALVLLQLAGVGTAAVALTNRGEAPASPQNQTIPPLNLVKSPAPEVTELAVSDALYQRQLDAHWGGVAEFLKADKKQKDDAARAARLAAATIHVNRGTTRSVIHPPADLDSQDVYDWLADCETGKRLEDGTVVAGTRRNDAGGGFDGYFQFLPSTFRNLGGTGRAYEHSYATQKAIAQKIPISAWDTQFPDCNRRLRRMGVI